MKKAGRSLTHILLVAAGLVYAGAGWSQSLGLPPGKGRDTVMQVCTACHGLDHITNPYNKMTAEDWKFYLYEMVSRGAPLRKEDLPVVREYLIKNFAVDRK